MNDDPSIDRPVIEWSHISGFLAGCVVAVVLLAMIAMSAKIDRLQAGRDAPSVEPASVRETVLVD